jgi:predicted dehydrogenase
VAVDAPGVRSVLKTTEEARAKGLAIVSGLCWRYDLGVRDTIKRIQNGAIGNIIAIQENYLADTLWHRGRKPEWSDMEYQIRNWLYYTWLSGDHNVEQHIHSLDKAMWLMGDKPPLAAVGLGGRQVRTGDEWGNIFDHHAVAYEWADGVRVYSFTRQQGDCFPETEDFILGTKGAGVGARSPAKIRRSIRATRRRRTRICTTTSTLSCTTPSARESRSTTALICRTARCWRSWAGWRPIPASESPGTKR